MKFDRRSLFRMIPAVVTAPQVLKKEEPTQIDFKKKFEESQKELEELKNKTTSVLEPPKFYGGYACSYSVYPFGLKNKP